MKNIKDLFENLLYQETGIPLLDCHQIVFQDQENFIKISLGNLSFSLIQEEDLEEQILDFLSDHLEEVKEELTKQIMLHLEAHLLPQIDKCFRENMRKKGLKEADLEDILVEVKNFGHFPSHHGMMEEEYTQGLPEIGLEVSSLNLPKIDSVGVLIEDFSGEFQVEELVEKFWREWTIYHSSV